MHHLIMKVTISVAYRNFKLGSSARNSCNGPVNSLFDKSLYKEVNFPYHFRRKDNRIARQNNISLV